MASTPGQRSRNRAIPTRNLDTEEPRKIGDVWIDVLYALYVLYAIDPEVSSLVEDYAQDTACCLQTPGVPFSHLVLSPTHRRRVTRASYRLNFLGVLFYNYDDCSHVEWGKMCPRRTSQTGAGCRGPSVATHPTWTWNRISSTLQRWAIASGTARGSKAEERYSGKTGDITTARHAEAHVVHGRRVSVLGYRHRRCQTV
jgi:hypothetical protein